MKIGFIGSGWRTQGYWRIIRQLPEHFTISGVFFRSAEKAAAFEAGNPGLAYTDLDQFLEQDHDCVMILVPRQAVLEYVEPCFKRQIPVLVETPPGNGLAELIQIYELKRRYNGRIQVAEQYYKQPYHSAVLSLIGKGLLGKVSNMRISMMHDYHGISVMRKVLGVSSEPCTITAQRFVFPVLFHCGRDGLIKNPEQIIEDSRKVAAFAFDNGTVGFFDFADEQYFNYFRSRHMNVQGTHGEINDETVTYLSREGYPVTEKLERQDLGIASNLEGYAHRGITFNGVMVYENPFLSNPESRLSDDEIAMGSILLGMERYIATGQEIYSLEEALQDTYLYLMMDEAIRRGAPVRTEQQPWSGKG